MHSRDSRRAICASADGADDAGVKSLRRIVSKIRIISIIRIIRVVSIVSIVRNIRIISIVSIVSIVRATSRQRGAVSGRSPKSVRCRSCACVRRTRAGTHAHERQRKHENASTLRQKRVERASSARRALRQRYTRGAADATQ